MGAGSTAQVTNTLNAVTLQVMEGFTHFKKTKLLFLNDPGEFIFIRTSALINQLARWASSQTC